MLAKAVFAQTHRHLYFFDLCGQQNSIRYLQKTNDKSVISEYQLSLIHIFRNPEQNYIIYPVARAIRHTRKHAGKASCRHSRIEKIGI